MNNLKQEIEELIIHCIINFHNPNQIETKSDILQILRNDDIEEIKDRLWDIIKYDLDYNLIYDEIEKYKDEEEDEEEKKSDTESDSE